MSSSSSSSSAASGKGKAGTGDRSPSPEVPSAQDDGDIRSGAVGISSGKAIDVSGEDAVDNGRSGKGAGSGDATGNGDAPEEAGVSSFGSPDKASGKMPAPAIAAVAGPPPPPSQETFLLEFSATADGFVAHYL